MARKNKFKKNLNQTWSKFQLSNLTMEIASNALNGNCPPLLGICLGHQAIGLAAGWDLCKTPTGAVHGEVHIIENINSTLIKSNNKMTSYLTYNLTRHSDHHVHAQKEFWELNPCDNTGVVLPSGYLTYILLFTFFPLSDFQSFILEPFRVII